VGNGSAETVGMRKLENANSVHVKSKEYSGIKMPS